MCHYSPRCTDTLEGCIVGAALHPDFTITIPGPWNALRQGRMTSHHQIGFQTPSSERGVLETVVRSCLFLHSFVDLSTIWFKYFEHMSAPGQP